MEAVRRNIELQLTIHTRISISCRVQEISADWLTSLCTRLTAC